MKYFITENCGIEVAVIFSELLQHVNVAANQEILSAGFCDMEGNTWGKSVSLGTKPRPEDKQVIIDSIRFKSC